MTGKDLRDLFGSAVAMPDRDTLDVEAVIRDGARRRNRLRAAEVTAGVVLVLAIVVTASAIGVTRSAPSTEPTPSSSQLNTTGLVALDWRFDNEHSPAPTDTELRLRINWPSCAGFAVPDHPIQDIEYSADQIRVTVWAKPPASSDADSACPAPEGALLVIPLKEAVGNRDVLHG